MLPWYLFKINIFFISKNNYLTCRMDLFWSKHQNSADWREDYVRDQQKVKVVNSVFEKFQKIDETKLKNVFSIAYTRNIRLKYY